jgi:TusA-related sulfurtransferase
MDSDTSTGDMILDIRGQICPACLLVTLREIYEHREVLNSGGVRLVIQTDHRDATRTIPGAVSAMGYHVSVSKVRNYYEIELEYKNDE